MIPVQDQQLLVALIDDVLETLEHAEIAFVEYVIGQWTKAECIQLLDNDPASRFVEVYINATYNRFVSRDRLPIAEYRMMLSDDHRLFIRSYIDILEL